MLSDAPQDSYEAVAPVAETAAWASLRERGLASRSLSADKRNVIEWPITEWGWSRPGYCRESELAVGLGLYPSPVERDH